MGCTSSSTNVDNNNRKPEQSPTPQMPANSSNDSSMPTAAIVANPTKDGTLSGGTSNAGASNNRNSENYEQACFGAGCYWGTEKYFKYKFIEQFGDLGRISNGRVGFMGPDDAPPNPTYREVCSGTTGHVEVYNFEYNGGKDQYEALVRYFFQFHDPSMKNRQGNDKGTQYASVIYCYNDEQKAIAHRVKDELQSLIDCGKLKPYSTKVVETDIRDSTIFYPAHDEHQDYLTANPNGYCNHRMRFKEWPKLEG